MLQANIMKIADKNLRSELMDKIVEFKNMVCAIYNVMANDDKEQIDNLLIAQLNDVSYKAIRKRGVQKTLDARAIKNETLLKKLEM